MEAAELKDRILEYLANPFIGAVVVPIGTLILTLVAELASISHRAWNREDAAVGFDVLMAAFGSQIAFMASPNSVRPQAHVQVDLISINDVLTVFSIDIDIEFGMLTAILWLTIGALLWIKKYGSTASGGFKWSGVDFPIACGLVALGMVYWVNARLLGAS